MNEGLEIVSKRIETNPEEFIGEDNKWRRVYHRLVDQSFPWTEEEKEFIQIIKAKIQVAEETARRDRFVKLVMETLMTENNQYTPSPFGQVPLKSEGQRATPYNYTTDEERETTVRQLKEALKEWRNE